MNYHVSVIVSDGSVHYQVVLWLRAFSLGQFDAITRIGRTIVIQSPTMKTHIILFRHFLDFHSGVKGKEIKTHNIYGCIVEVLLL
jgi:hypothetical protein